MFLLPLRELRGEGFTCFKTPATSSDFSSGVVSCLRKRSHFNTAFCMSDRFAQEKLQAVPMSKLLPEKSHFLSAKCTSLGIYTCSQFTV